MSNQTETRDFLRLIRCDFGEETYCMDMSLIHSVQGLDYLKLNPKDENTIGWLGEIPVFSVPMQLRRSMVRNKDTGRILVLNVKPKPWGLMVDRILDVIEIKADSVLPMPYIAQNPLFNLFEGVIKVDEKLILYLSPERLRSESPLNLEKPLKGNGKLTSNKRNKRPKTTLSDRTMGNRKGRILFFSTVDSKPNGRMFIFGLSVAQVLEVLEPIPLVPVPGSPPYVLGLANWRSRPVPVVDLNVCLGLGLSLYRNSRLLIVRGSNRNELVGFPIRPNVIIRNLPIAYQLCDRDLPLDKSLTRGIFELESETLVVPDVDTIISSHGGYPH